MSSFSAANANGRDIGKPHDLPVTKGMQGSIRQFRRIDEELELQPILDRGSFYAAPGN